MNDSLNPKCCVQPAHTYTCTMFANNKISLTQNIIGNLKETKKKIYLTYDLPIQEFKYKEKKFYLQMQKVHVISKSDNKNCCRLFMWVICYTSGSLP